jgi:capsular polysaccharide export protein
LKTALRLFVQQMTGAWRVRINGLWIVAPQMKGWHDAGEDGVTMLQSGNTLRARRSFLFLQGMASGFFSRLGEALSARGHGVSRINFNAGDRLFWRCAGALDFRGTAAEWPAFLAGVLERRSVTDIILFGDCRPLHRRAIQVARALQVNVHVCEEGYLRPHWVTFERDGVNGHSCLPRNADWYREVGATLPPLPPMPQIPSSFRRRAWEDLIYNAATLALQPFYPHYRSHRPRHRLVEYAGWSRKVAMHPMRARRAAAANSRINDTTRFFLLPLQLNGDTQIRLHSRFGGMTPVIAEIIESFSRHAPADTMLVVKEHPLDDGLINWRRLVASLAAEAGVSDRIIYLEFGDLDWLVSHAEGVVTVNSTTGTLALSLGIPVITLGTAIYDIVGLTHQDTLETFWTTPAFPDPDLYAAFRRVLCSRCLLVGNFFSEAGIRLLVDEAVRRLESDVTAHPAVTIANAEPFSRAEGGFQEVAVRP